MFTVLIINQKGGVGKTTIADELAFALERREYKTVYVSTDPQGGAVHEQPEDFSEIEGADFQVVDTAGVLSDGLGEWCINADMILIPLMPSCRDLEPTLRTYEIAQSSGTKAPIFFIVNGYYPYGVLDQELLAFMKENDMPVIAKVPKTVALSRAAAGGVSVADFDKRNPSVAVFEQLADNIIQHAASE